MVLQCAFCHQGKGQSRLGKTLIAQGFTKAVVTPDETQFIDAFGSRESLRQRSPEEHRGTHAGCGFDLTRAGQEHPPTEPLPMILP
jgi:hypothetical protein